MKRMINGIVVAAVLLLLVACSGGKKVEGDGKIVTQNRSVTAFNELDANGDFVVTLNTNQSAPAVEIKTDENILPYLVTQNDKNKLIVSVKPGYRLKPTLPIQVAVSAKVINSVQLNGRTTFIAGALSGDQFALSINGTGTSVLKGVLQSLAIMVNGAAHVNAEDLAAENVSVKIFGVAQTSVKSSKKLNVYIKGSGRVIFYGDPPIVDQEVYGGGKIIRG